MSYSKNARAEQIVGKRNLPHAVVILNSPAEEGYRCPVCRRKRLEWSEYNGFIWCSVCNRDYPSCLCMPDIDRAINIYLSCVEEAMNSADRNQQKEEVE